MYKVKAVWKKDLNHYYHFGIHPKTAPLYGDKPEDIVEVNLKISEDQSIREVVEGVVDYWAFHNFEKDELEFIYPSLIQVQICSPDFFKSEIKAGRGILVRVEVDKDK